MRALPAALIAAALAAPLAAGQPAQPSAQGPRAHEIAPAEPVQAKARARILRVYRSGPRLAVRYRVDPGAARVIVRLWRSVLRAGQPPGWSPLGVPLAIPRSAGLHTAVVRRAPLRYGVYQVRVTVVSEGGPAVASTRYVASRPARTR